MQTTSSPFRPAKPTELERLGITPETASPEIAEHFIGPVLIDGDSLGFIWKDEEYFVTTPTEHTARVLGEAFLADLDGTDGPSDLAHLLIRFGFRRIDS